MKGVFPSWSEQKSTSAVYLRSLRFKSRSAEQLSWLRFSGYGRLTLEKSWYNNHLALGHDQYFPFLYNVLIANLNIIR